MSIPCTGDIWFHSTCPDGLLTASLPSDYFHISEHKFLQKIQAVQPDGPLWGHIPGVI